MLFLDRKKRLDLFFDVSVPAEEVEYVLNFLKHILTFTQVCISNEVVQYFQLTIDEETSRPTVISVLNQTFNTKLQYIPT